MSENVEIAFSDVLGAVFASAVCSASEFEPQPGHITFVGHEIISTIIRPLPLIQEGQLSVTVAKYVHLGTVYPII